jgi:hypothetical protein
MTNLTKSQNLSVDDQHVQYLMGWQKELIVDKCLRNEVQDVLLVNFPSDLRPRPPVEINLNDSASMESPMTKIEDPTPKNKQCSTFVYAAYLPPGLHQFLIYCPKTKRAFCKDIVVDLSECEPFPE